MTKKDVLYELFWLMMKTNHEDTLNAIRIARQVISEDPREEYEVSEDA